MLMKSIYLIGSLRNPQVLEIAKRLRSAGFDVFDDWHASGPEADDWWQRYEQSRGRSYLEALRGFAAHNVFQFDRQHINRCAIGVLLLPCGKSGHLELGYMLGQGKQGYVLYQEEPERWDCMYQFASGVFTDVDTLIETLAATQRGPDA